MVTKGSVGVIVFKYSIQQPCDYVGPSTSSTPFPLCFTLYVIDSHHGAEEFQQGGEHLLLATYNSVVVIIDLDFSILKQKMMPKEQTRRKKKKNINSKKKNPNQLREQCHLFQSSISPMTINLVKNTFFYTNFSILIVAMQLLHKSSICITTVHDFEYVPQFPPLNTMKCPLGFLNQVTYVKYLFFDTTIFTNPICSRATIWGKKNWFQSSCYSIGCFRNGGQPIGFTLNQ